MGRSQASALENVRGDGVTPWDRLAGSGAPRASPATTSRDGRGGSTSFLERRDGLDRRRRGKERPHAVSARDFRGAPPPSRTSSRIASRQAFCLYTDKSTESVRRSTRCGAAVPVLWTASSWLDLATRVSAAEEERSSMSLARFLGHVERREEAGALDDLQRVGDRRREPPPVVERGRTLRKMTEAILFGRFFFFFFFFFFFLKKKKKKFFFFFWSSSPAAAPTAARTAAVEGGIVVSRCASAPYAGISANHKKCAAARSATTGRSAETGGSNDQLRDAQQEVLEGVAAGDHEATCRSRLRVRPRQQDTRSAPPMSTPSTDDQVIKVQRRDELSTSAATLSIVDFAVGRRRAPASAPQRPGRHQAPTDGAWKVAVVRDSGRRAPPAGRRRHCSSRLLDDGRAGVV